MEVLIESRISEAAPFHRPMKLDASTTLVRIHVEDAAGRRAIAFVNALQTPSGIWFELTVKKSGSAETSVHATATLKVPRHA